MDKGITTHNQRALNPLASFDKLDALSDSVGDMHRCISINDDFRLFIAQEAGCVTDVDLLYTAAD